MRKSDWLATMGMFAVGTIVAWTDHPMVGVCLVIYAGAMRIALSIEKPRH